MGQHILLASTGGAWHMAAGQTVRIVNSHGTQAVDAWALAADGSETGDGTVQYSSMEHTRSVNSSIYIDTGLSVMGMDRRPLFTMVEDATPGHHDTQLCPCNGPLYADLGQPPAHRSCAGNFHDALAQIGLEMPFTPASLNLFMRVRVGPEGEILRDLPVAAPGDHVTLKAERAIILVLSACPQDVTPINGADCTPHDIHLEFSRGPL
ncbi:MAG: urea carboxylase-associated family protein [Pseudodonghicola sp.]|nr:urea carboxylase-associated family protein [Pseudodonghicola sp.]